VIGKLIMLIYVLCCLFLIWVEWRPIFIDWYSGSQEPLPKIARIRALAIAIAFLIPLIAIPIIRVVCSKLEQ